MGDTKAGKIEKYDDFTDMPPNELQSFSKSPQSLKLHPRLRFSEFQHPIFFLGKLQSGGPSLGISFTFFYSVNQVGSCVRKVRQLEPIAKKKMGTTTKTLD